MHVYTIYHEGGYQVLTIGNDLLVVYFILQLL